MSHKKGKSQRVKSVKEKPNIPNEDGVWSHDKVIAEEEAKKQIPKEAYYKYTKRGDTVDIVMASVFAFFFIMPGLSVMATSQEFTGGLICLAISIIPLRVIKNQWFSITAEIKNNTVYYTKKELFKATIFWEEPISRYFDITRKDDGNNSEIILLHSADDNKNVILYSEFYKYYRELDEKFDEISQIIKRTNIGKDAQHIQIKLNEAYTEKNFFDVYNQTKQASEGADLVNVMLPGKHLKILKDEDEVCFSVAFNKGLKLFATGLICLGLSFVLLPFCFSGFELGVIACLVHLAGVLLYNFGQTEEIIKAEGRSLVIGVRWLKRKLVVKNSIAFSDVKQVEVIKSNGSDGSGKEIYSLKIITDKSNYIFGNTIYKEELDWLAETMKERIMRINSRSRTIVTDNY